MPTILDTEFGAITLRRSARASAIRIRLAPNGLFRISMPMYTPLFLVKRFVNSSRSQLREILAAQHEAGLQLSDGQQIGKSHTLIVRQATKPTSATRHNQQIILLLHPSDSLNDPFVISIARKVIIEALRREAKSYLPKRLSYLADRHGFYYEKVRFSHASGRWGSCSTSGTISLNIALMKLSFELIDYVLLHELSHTKEMNHSEAFWQQVAGCDPHYLQNRTRLKKETPSV